MTSSEAESVKQDIFERYRSRTEKSFSLRQESARYLPGGETRSIAYYPPYPFYASEGKGSRLYDIDGNEYIDCVNNMTALIHGHAHPHIVEAICAQAAKGTAHAAPIGLQGRLAEMICDRTPSVESIRFCNSGTEATLFALRAARIFTGKEVIVKMDAGYHGSHDYVEVNLLPDFEAVDLPASKVEPGVPKAVADGVRVAPFNDLNAMERILEADKDNIAAIILEPVLAQGGGIIPRDGYLQGLRELADKYGVLLIFDEIITYRAHVGGFQSTVGVKPDLTTFGKIIGGGLPVGAFGGRKDIMEMFDPSKPDSITHSGTFSGNALTMAAGAAALEILGQDEIDRINLLGDRLQAGLKSELDGAGLKGRVGGFGSMALVCFTEQPFNNAREAVLAIMPTLEMTQILHLELVNQGVYAIARGIIGFTVSTPMDDQEVDLIASRFGRALEVIAPLAKELGL